MKIELITDSQIKNRGYWIDKIKKLSGNFVADSDKVEQELSQEIARRGVNTIIGHLRLCGVIPEEYGHDTMVKECRLYLRQLIGG